MVLDAFECLMDEALPKSFPWHVAIYSIKTRFLLSKNLSKSRSLGVDQEKFNYCFAAYSSSLEGPEKDIPVIYVYDGKAY